MASAQLDGAIQTPLPAGRGFGSSLLLAREWGLADLEARLAEAIEVSFEPTWDAARGEFTWGMGLNEPHPRGQFNAFLAAAEVAGPGAWERLSAAPLAPQPQVVGVDFPTVALQEAEWREGVLHLTVAPVVDDPRATTRFTVIGVEAGRNWGIGATAGSVEPSAGDRVVVEVPVVAASYRVAPR